MELPIFQVCGHHIESIYIPFISKSNATLFPPSYPTSFIKNYTTHQKIASNRTNKNFRLRNFNHNINILVYLINGTCADYTDNDVSSTKKPLNTKLTEYLVGTGWRPSVAVFDALSFTGFTSMQLNHASGDIKEIYSSASFDSSSSTVVADDIDPREFTPFYWSAGNAPSMKPRS